MAAKSSSEDAPFGDVKEDMKKLEQPIALELDDDGDM
jgi:hypothetical protein